MNVMTRGMRNAFRNSVRTVGIVLILALTIGLAVTMLIARSAVDSKIKTVKSSIGNTISISPAGARGFMGGGEPLTQAELAKVSSIAHVTAIASTLQDRLTTTNSSLTSAVEAGSLGRRFRGDSTDGGATSSASAGRGNFTPPVTVIGSGSLDGTILEGGNALTLTSGAKFDPTKDAAVALVGKTLATKNNLSVGSNFTAYGTAVKVAGIYDAGTTFANNTVVMPLTTLQRLSSQTGDVSAATVTVDDVSNVDAATTAIQSALGTDVADVTNTQSAVASALTPLENIRSISTYSLLGAIAAGAVIILLTMVMIVRERRREIGVLKAIGASNISVVTQFVTEAITFTLLAVVLGLALGAVAGGPVTKVLATSSTASQAATNGSGGFGGRAARSITNAAGLSGQSLRNLKTDVGAKTLLTGLGAAMLIAILGSAIPAMLIAKIQPAEVMRAE